MDKIFSILAYVGLAVLLVGFGWVCGRKSASDGGLTTVAKNATVTDTLWVEVHDTCWRETTVTFLRKDTVRLAYVPDSAISGTYQSSNVHENGISGTYTDTLFVHDSVYVEVPIESHTFIGDHYRITAHGYRVGLDDVWFDRQVVTSTVTHTKYMNKRWRLNVGAQIGYGYTLHGASPYAGVGVAFGYTF